MARKRSKKHNKKRNTAILYEVLVRELTTAALSGDKKLQSEAVGLCKKFFSKNTPLGKELTLYRGLNENYGFDERTAERFLEETCLEYSKIDKEEIFNEQSRVVSKINRMFGTKAFSNFVPDYKSLATISQIFNDSITSKEKVLLEKVLIENMTATPALKEERKLEALDSLAFKTFVKSFNKKYGKELLPEQRDLLSLYILSLDNDDIELKHYMNGELTRLKEIVSESLSSDEINSDQDMKEKTGKVMDLMESYKQVPIEGKMIEEVLKIQSLAKELEDDANRDSD